jgi:hypothetical protein
VEWPPGPDDGGDGERTVSLTVEDVGDVAYQVLLDRVERQALALQQQFATYRAAGAEVDEEWPSLDWAQAQLDATLEAEQVGEQWSSLDRELLQLMGVA